MTDGPDNLVLPLLRRIDERTIRMAEGIHDLKVRATPMEENMAVLNRRVDRLEDRLGRIEVRLGLVEV